MNLTMWAWIYGLLFVAIGVLGFIPGAVTPDGLLLGIFSVDAMTGAVSLIAGALAFAAIRGGQQYLRTYFRVFGVLFAIITALSLLGGDSVLGMMTTNSADIILNLVLAGVALWLGFGKREEKPVLAEQR